MTFAIDSLVILLVSGNHSAFIGEMKLSMGELCIRVPDLKIDAIIPNDSMYS